VTDTVTTYDPSAGITYRHTDAAPALRFDTDSGTVLDPITREPVNVITRRRSVPRDTDA
jgi:hypothetical protein